MTMDKVLEFLGQVLASSVLILSFLVPMLRWLGEKWIEARVSQRMADYEYRLNMLLSRASKIHSEEFQILPEAWRKLQDALGHIAEVTRPLQSYVDIRGMTEQELLDDLHRHEVSDYAIRRFLERGEQLRNHERQDAYNKLVLAQRVAEAEHHVAEYHNYVLYNKIVLGQELYEQFLRMDNLLNRSLVSAQASVQSNEPRQIIEAWKTLQEKADPMAGEIAKLIRERLGYDQVG